MSDELALILNQQLAGEMAQPKFTELMQLISSYEVQSSNVRVTNDAEYQMCVDSLIAVADVEKSLENMRKAIVSYPNVFVKTVNATFKGLKERCGKTRGRLSYPSQKYKTDEDAKAMAAAAAQPVQAELPIEVTDGEATVQQEAPTAPMQSVKGVDGKGSVSYRKGPPVIEIVNAAKLVRAALNAKNKISADVIQIDLKVLRGLVDSGVYTLKQWEKYGVKVTETEQQVVRS